MCYHSVSSVVVDMPGYRKAWQVGDNLQPFDAHPEFEENLGHFILGHFRFLHCTKVLIEFIQELCSQCLQLVPQPFLGPRQFVAHRGCARLEFIAERLKTRVQLFLCASCLSMQVPPSSCTLVASTCWRLSTASTASCSARVRLSLMASRRLRLSS